MNNKFHIFNLRDNLISDYKKLVMSFFGIKNKLMQQYVETELEKGAFWPSPLVQLNPAFKLESNISALVEKGVLHPECKKIFRRDKEKNKLDLSATKELELYTHQVEALLLAQKRKHYVVTTGTGSGKSLSFIIPIVNDILKNKENKNTTDENGIQAIIVYPMNALANSQLEELHKYVEYGYQQAEIPIRVARYTGQEKDEERNKIKANVPDILLTNYVMLELMLTRSDDQRLLDKCKNLRYLVFDELHIYRGRQGSDVSLLIRRLKERSQSKQILCIGTSATIAAEDSTNPKADVANCAAKIFGAEFSEDSIIGETLIRNTKEYTFELPSELEILKSSINKWYIESDSYIIDLKNDPLCAWIESTIGLIKDPYSKILSRAKPRPLDGEFGIVYQLAELVKMPVEVCMQALKNCLFNVAQNKDGNKALFPFKLHQFISRGGNLYATLDKNHFTLEPKRYMESNENTKLFLPTAFCRKCGADYFSVTKLSQSLKNPDPHFEPREDLSIADDEDEKNKTTGFLYIPSEINKSIEVLKQEVFNKVPEEWINDETEENEDKFAKKYYEFLPKLCFVSLEGNIFSNQNANTLPAFFFKRPFRFCLECGEYYTNTRSKDFQRLATLGTEGRSTSTSVLALSVIQSLKKADSLDTPEKKLMSFTDNRQDASLQVGHFNDFIETVQMRRALWQALNQAPFNELKYEDLKEQIFAVFTKNKLNYRDYVINKDLSPYAPGVKQATGVLKELFAYRCVLDLSSDDWRFSLPNLERAGVICYEIPDLKHCFAEQYVYQQIKREAFLNLTKYYPECIQKLDQNTKEEIEKFIDNLSKEQLEKYTTDLCQDFIKNLCIDCKEYLTKEGVTQLANKIKKDLSEYWHIEDPNDSSHSKIQYAVPFSVSDKPLEIKTYSTRSNFGKKIKTNLLKEYSPKQIEYFIAYLFSTLITTGVAVTSENKGVSVKNAIALKINHIVWKIKCEQLNETSKISFQYFRDLYKEEIQLPFEILAAEHTAQIRDTEREERENKFRNGEIQLLCCSPTMELGVDISSLYVVNMRNVPPTPANYAQRSGRAGRGGQAALVYTYCSSGNSHDQYFFRNAQEMVAGSVKPPPLDLSNEDLIRSHVHAIWLACANLKLGSAMVDVIDLNDERPFDTQLKPEIKSLTEDETLFSKAFTKAKRILTEVPEIKEAEWFTKNEFWLENVLKNAAKNFDEAFNRWRTLFRSAYNQQTEAHKLLKSHSASKEQRDRAKRESNEAEMQLEYLRGDGKDKFTGDFYPYRYLACEGFLPGYNFPRLPLSAFIPGVRSSYTSFRRRFDDEKPEFLARPRFIAISEFGPQAFIYHNGSRYQINKVILPQRDKDGSILKKAVYCCKNCGYMSPRDDKLTYDVCENCLSHELEIILDCFHMQNVSTWKKDRITSDEEERTKYGYKIRTLFRYTTKSGEKSVEKLNIKNKSSQILFSLSYAPVATLWRLNEGWIKKNKSDVKSRGFYIDTITGRWESAPTESDSNEENRNEDFLRRELIVPYVEDHKNILHLERFPNRNIEFLASLQSAFKTAIQIICQLSDGELSAEILPSHLNPSGILFYESAEGGAGALRKITSQHKYIVQVAKKALKLCHYDPETGAEEYTKDHKDYCAKACYRCLMNYSNQKDHSYLDRTLLRDYLLDVINSTSEKLSTAGKNSEDQLNELLPTCESNLEKEFLTFLKNKGYYLPQKSQVFIQEINARPDFLYLTITNSKACIFIDGPHHDAPEIKKQDLTIDENCLDYGMTSLRFRYNEKDQWEKIIQDNPDIFGVGS
ncbi:DEAD/DEAH box helicase [Pigmentibacter ruber]